MDQRIESSEGQTLLRASLYCKKVESAYIALIIVMALTFSIVSIFIKFLPQLAVLLELIERHETVDGKVVDTAAFINFSETCSVIGRYISFAAGLWLILQIVLAHRANIKHKEAVNLEERYDVYVLNIEPNKNIMRPITNSTIRHYASRLPEHRDYRKNIQKEKNAQLTAFYYQKSAFEYEYGLMFFARNKFFNRLWFLYFAVIITFSIMLNTSLIDALTLIFFPSLSAISLIINSMLSYNEQFRYVSNALDCIKAVEDKMIEEKRSTIPASVLRNIQDSLFICRKSSFTIPLTIEKAYNRKLRRAAKKKERRMLQEAAEKAQREKWEQELALTRKMKVETTKTATIMPKTTTPPKKTKAAASNNNKGKTK